MIPYGAPLRLWQNYWWQIRYSSTMQYKLSPTDRVISRAAANEQFWSRVLGRVA